jgi:4'-phosphopantetheinyl transferase
VIRATSVGERLGSVTVQSAAAEIWFAWIGDHGGDVDRYSRDYLSTDERAHLEGYRIRDAAERYVVTRSLVRVVLSERLGMSPREIQVSHTDTGKPIVTKGVHFNVSHSGNLVLLALSDLRPVGVDVERKREVLKVRALSDRWLSPAERQDFARLREMGIADSDAFLRIWSLKEAQLKALGVGISGASRARFDTVDVRPLDDLLGVLAGQRAESDYVGAIAFA